MRKKSRICSPGCQDCFDSRPASHQWGDYPTCDTARLSHTHVAWITLYIIPFTFVILPFWTPALVAVVYKYISQPPTPPRSALTQCYRSGIKSWASSSFGAAWGRVLRVDLQTWPLAIWERDRKIYNQLRTWRRTPTLTFVIGVWKGARKRLSKLAKRACSNMHAERAFHTELWR